MTRVRLLALAAAAFTALSLSPTPAGAHHTDTADPNDTKGRLDIREVRLAHTGRPELTVVTFARWTPAQIWDRGSFFMFLDTQGDERAEYYVLVRSTGKRLEATLWRDRAGAPDVLIKAVASDRTARSVTVRIPLNALTIGGSRTAYFWWVNSTFTGKVCRRTCIDRAPNADAIEQELHGTPPEP
jgi:hypothetical protein